MEEKFLQQLGARPHTANAVVEILNENFHDRVTFNR
jgi:hypothetical protein